MGFPARSSSPAWCTQGHLWGRCGGGLDLLSCWPETQPLQAWPDGPQASLPSAHPAPPSCPASFVSSWCGASCGARGEAGAPQGVESFSWAGGDHRPLQVDPGEVSGGAEAPYGLCNLSGLCRGLGALPLVSVDVAIRRGCGLLPQTLPARASGWLFPGGRPCLGWGSRSAHGFLSPARIW